jgi:homoserine dehydrogenase
VKDPHKKRSVAQEKLTFNADDILDDHEINVVIETINGSDDAFYIVSEALRRGKAVISANKKMVAGHFAELLAIQDETGMPLLYEGAACGGIPIVRTLEEHFGSEPLESVSGIFNGTSNYILSNMFRNGSSLDAALLDAQRLGFAELDPSSDIDGDDAKYKLILLAAHSLGILARPESVLSLGIRHLRKADIAYARALDCKIKLTPVSRRVGENKLVLYVLPSLIHEDHFLYHVENEYNGVEIQGTYSGIQHLRGRGAGSLPTGSALLSDLNALRHGYRYQYRKKRLNGQSVLEQNHGLNLYVRAPKHIRLDELSLKNAQVIDETEETYSIIGIGTLSFLLEQKPWLDEHKIFIMQIP